MATAYIRARGADRMSSYGDFVALSDECDVADGGFPCQRGIGRRNCSLLFGEGAGDFEEQAQGQLSHSSDGSFL